MVYQISQNITLDNSENSSMAEVKSRIGSKLQYVLRQYPLVMINIAMENHDVSLGKKTISMVDLLIVMFNYQRVMHKKH